MIKLFWGLLFVLGFLVAIRVCSLLAEHTSGRLRKAIFYPLATLAFLIAGAGPLAHWYVASDPSFLYAIWGLLWWINVGVMLCAFGNPNGKCSQLTQWEIDVVNGLWTDLAWALRRLVGFVALFVFPPFVLVAAVGGVFYLFGGVPTAGVGFMRPELTICAAVWFCGLGVFSAAPMFPAINRPGLFRGRWGELLFLAINTTVIGSSVSLLLWSFLNVTWYITILVIVGSGSIFSVVYRFLPPILVCSALAPFVSAVGLLFLHRFTWFTD